MAEKVVPSMISVPEDAVRKASTIAVDLRAGLIVFLVALPLCLGIATASGAPAMSGLVAGIVGGTVVAWLSGSQLSVAGPAAGLTVIVLDGMQRLGLHAFSVSVLLAGGIQIALGALGAGRLAQLVPNAVIRGMMAAIGLILVLKQLPHAVGYDADPEGDFAFSQRDGHNTFSELFYALEYVTLGAIAVSVVAALTLYLWRNYRGLPLTRYVPRELMAVCTGAIAGLLFEGSALDLAAEHRVSMPLLQQGGLRALWSMPDWSAFQRLDVWRLGLTLSLVASIESLLCLEATDRIDPQRRTSAPNRELFAQGSGNLVSGLLGGLPLTAVVVRSFTNVQAGGRTRLASLTHGVLLLFVALFLGRFINHVPLAALAVVLLLVGYKLTSPRLYLNVWRSGRAQFLPFAATIVAILVTDLLTGTLFGFAFAAAFVLYGHYTQAIMVTDDGKNRLIRFVSDVSFLHKARLKEAFESAPHGGEIIVDGTRARLIDPDVIDALDDLQAAAKTRGIEFTVQRSQTALHAYFQTGGVKV
ncbi:MAG TPA: SulP family inorganic anion transporter [Polyangiales bacterium]|nr:SulP family inorganic anion transporter [Polyangiales bacterium]